MSSILKWPSRASSADSGGRNQDDDWTFGDQSTLLNNNTTSTSQVDLQWVGALTHISNCYTLLFKSRSKTTKLERKKVEMEVCARLCRM